MSPSNLTREEMETHLNMVGDDHGTWLVYSDDPVMIRRLESIGATFVRASGSGKHYTLTSDQVLLRKGKRQVSEETKAATAERLKEYRSRTTGS